MAAARVPVTAAEAAVRFPAAAIATVPPVTMLAAAVISAAMRMTATATMMMTTFPSLAMTARSPG